MELLQLIEKLIVSIKDATETDVRKCEDWLMKIHFLQTKKQSK
jgi:hypothetical protein